MAIAPFFERVYGALGGHLAISRDSLDRILGDSAVGIRCDGRLSQNDLWIAELTINLLSRLYPRIGLSGSSKYTSALHNLAKSINPDVETTTTSSAMTTIQIGSSTANDGRISPQASGWVAQLSSAPRLRGPANPFSAAAAASLACAEIFRRVFLGSNAVEPVSVSLLNFDQESGLDLPLGKVDVGDVLFVGVGAVGNAAIWALSRIKKLCGSVTLVDDETVALSNLQRYVLTTLDSVGLPKTTLAQSQLAKTSLAITDCPQRIEQINQPQHQTIAVSVDNVAGRRAAQALLPKLVVNGWTGEQGLGASWHELSRDAACLACLYHPHGQGPSAVDQAAKALGLTSERAALLWVTHQPMTQPDIDASATSLGVTNDVLAPWLGKSLGELYTDVVCGAVPLDVTGVGRVEVVPLAHQSAFAGVLMASELVKRTNQKLARISQVEPLASWDNVLKAPPKYWVKPRPREIGCICTDKDYQDRYSSKWGMKATGVVAPRA